MDGSPEHVPRGPGLADAGALRTNIARVALSLFILGTGVAATRFTRRLFRLIGLRYGVSRRTDELISAVPTAAFLVVAALGVIQLWGALTISTSSRMAESYSVQRRSSERA